MRKIHSPYDESSILDVNLEEIYETRKMRFSMSEVLLVAVPLFLCVILFVGTMLPDIGFVAECQNIPGGDICSINIK